MRTISLGLPLAAIACATPPEPITATVGNSIPVLNASRFPVDNPRIDWPDTPQRAPATGIGNSVRVALRLDRPGAAPRRWLLDLHVLAPDVGKIGGIALNDTPIKLQAASVGMTVREIGRGDSDAWHALIPIASFAAGMSEASRMSQGDAVPVDSEADIARVRQRFTAGIVCGMSLMYLVQAESSLTELARAVCQTPSVLSVLTTMGIALSADFRFDESIRLPAAAVEDLPSHHSVHSLPITLSINREPALYCRLLVTEPWPPLTPVAGILGMIGEHPSNPEIRVTARVIDARLSPEPEAVTPFDGSLPHQ